MPSTSSEDFKAFQQQAHMILGDDIDPKFLDEIWQGADGVSAYDNIIGRITIIIYWATTSIGHFWVRCGKGQMG
jgi:hypothetical protein